jgi:hypothetical protein
MPRSPSPNRLARSSVGRPHCPSASGLDTELPVSTLALTNGSNGQVAAPTPPVPDGRNGDTSPNTATAPNGSHSRDTRGRFTRGNPGGPGNPFARRLARLRQALCQRVTEADIEALADQLLERARQGDLAATKLLFAYVIGKPTAAVDPDTLDREEWRLHQQGTVTPEQVLAVLQGLPPPAPVPSTAEELRAGRTRLPRQPGPPSTNPLGRLRPPYQVPGVVPARGHGRICGFSVPPLCLGASVVRLRDQVLSGVRDFTASSPSPACWRQ